MSVTSDYSPASATGNGILTAFDFNFKYYASSDIKVYLDGVLQGSGYTVTMDSDLVGGTVTFSTAPGNGVIILIARELPYTQPDRVPTVDRIPGNLLETIADRQTLQIQQTNEKVERAVKLPLGSTADADLPALVALKYPRINATADGFEFVDFVSTATVDIPTLSGNALKNLSVNSGASALEFTTPLANVTAGDAIAITSGTSIEVKVNTLGGIPSIAADDEMIISDDSNLNRVRKVTMANLGAFFADYSALVLLSETTVSSTVTEIDIAANIDSTYDTYLVQYTNLTLGTAGAHVYFRISDDGGSTFEAGASDYEYSTANFDPGVNGGSGTSVGTAAQIMLAEDVALDHSLNLMLILSNPASASLKTQVQTLPFGRAEQSGGRAVVTIAAGWYRTASANNAIRILPSTGNFTAATVRLWGIQ